MLLLTFAFLVVTRAQGIAVPNTSNTILTGGLIAAIVAFVGVLVTQYLTGKRHSEALVHTRELEAARAQDAALQRYFEHLGKLLADPDRPFRRSTLGDNLSMAARAQTLSILRGIDDPDRKRILLQFLYESELLYKNRPVIDLLGADLSRANLNRATLSRADLRRANLRGADLSGADLYEANLYGTDLSAANLSGANLSGADLSRADLSGADLSRADLSGADLILADLSRAKGITPKLLEQQARTLAGTIMPDGSKRV